MRQRPVLHRGGQSFFPSHRKFTTAFLLAWLVLVADASKTWGDEERRQRQHDVSLVDPRALLWRAATTADNGKWKITKRIFADPGRDSVVQRVTFQALEPGKGVKDYNVYVLNNPAINNTGPATIHGR